MGSYHGGVVEHVAPTDQFSQHVPGPLEEGHVPPHVGHHGGDNGGESLHRGELLDATGEGESPVADTGDVEVVSQGEAALVEHEVYNSEVEVCVLELRDEVLLEEGLAVRGEDDVVCAEHLAGRPEYVRP